MGQLGAILWKNLWVYRLKRHYILTAFELLVPLLLAILLASLRSVTHTFSGSLAHSSASLFLEFEPKVSGRLPVPLYAPNDTYVTSLLERVFGPDARGFPTEASLNDYVVREATKSGGVGTPLVVVIEAHPPDLRYKIRFNTSLYDFRTDKLFAERSVGERFSYADPYELVLWGIQQKMFASHLQLLNLTKATEIPRVTMRRFPYPEYYSADDGFSMAAWVPMLVVVGFAVFSPVFASRVVREKSSRIRELMCMMGLKDWVYWTGSFASGFVVMFTVSLLMMALLKIRVERDVAVLLCSDFTLLAVIMLLYCTAALLFLLNFTVIFSSPVAVVFAVMAAWLLTFFLPAFLLDLPGQDMYYFVGAGAKLGTTLLPNAALHWCFRLVTFMEAQEIGASWSRLWSPAVPGDNICLGQVMLVMLVSCFFYALLLWYLDSVWPYQYGVPKRPLFFLQKSYWLSEKGKRYSEIPFDDGQPGDGSVERPPPGAEISIALSNVTKRFPGASTNAVQDLSLKIYAGHITALLGHNGAGKTTTMNMITGLCRATSGQISINGHDILTSTKRAREDWGFCPQHDVLFDEMTVEEHLYFFLSLKKSRGIPWRAEVNAILEKLDLEDKRSTRASNLSGGMRRKLSLGNAMVGGFKTLILDEPTVGMDPEARRSVWDLLQAQRKHCTVLLTTHYMEEADVLGDRIAFLARGRLCCAGSPIFLKKKYGTGYKMRIAKADGCDVAALTASVAKTVPDSHLVSDLGHEAVYNLGFPPAADMVALFSKLEVQKERHGIASLGVSATTMEDVFIRVGELSEPPSSTEDASSNDTAALCCDVPGVQSAWQAYEKTAGLALLAQQARALFSKKWHAMRRHYCLPLFALLIPLTLVALYCWADNQNRGETRNAYKALSYHIGETFGRSFGFVRTDEGPLLNFVTNFYEPTASREKVKVKRLQGDPNEFLLSMGRKNLWVYTRRHLVGGETNGSRLVAWYNGEPLHVGAMSLNMAHAAVLRYVTGDASATVEVTNVPLPGQVEGRGGFALDEESELASDLLVAALVPTALSFLSASFVMFPTEERVAKAKLLQLMTGVPLVLFWGISFLWDLIIHAICCAIIMVPILAIDPSGAFRSSSGIAGATYVVLLMYGWASIPLSYVFSYAKEKPSAAYTLLVTANLLLGVIPAIVMLLLSYLATVESPSLNADAISHTLWLLRMIPNFALAWGFASVRRTGVEPFACASLLSSERDDTCLGDRSSAIASACCQPCPLGANATFCYIERSALRWNAAGPDVFFMFLTGLLLGGLLVISESFPHRLWNIWSRLPRASMTAKTAFRLDDEIDATSVSEDGTVSAERALVEELVDNGRQTDVALVVRSLGKNFGRLTAVNDVSFRVKGRECFGLLGVNGAGKTTTFRMLTGDLSPTSGNAYIGTADLIRHRGKFLSSLGYCPQSDAQLDKLSGREMLQLFAMLRGVPTNIVPRAVERMIDLCDLQEHAEEPTETYSGGTRRRLSVGMALVGRPEVVFLDEPTAGVDPAARRHLWQSLREMQQSTGAAVVLTTHSMEECEALCQRLGIMVNGRLRGLGSTQQLKDRFGRGFTVLVKLQNAGYSSATSGSEQGSANSLVSAASAKMQEEFPGAWELKESQQCLLHFHISNTELKWSYLFERMEAIKQELGFEDYVIGDTTLEQIFLAFAHTRRINTDTPVKV